MKNLWHKFLATLTTGACALLFLLSAVYLAVIIGRLTGAFDLSRWLAVIAANFWHGQVWRIASYALLPAGVMDFVMNAFALVMLGSQLERQWSRGELWIFCLIAAAGAGCAQVLLSPLPMSGAAPMMFGLLIAWMFISGHEVLLFPIFGQMSVRQMVLIFAGVSFLIMFFTAGWIRAVVMVSGGLTGWLYLWLRHKWLMSRPSRSVESGRINRLEL